MDQAYFDFRYEHDVPEGLDFSKLVDCPHCRKPIPRDATHCLYCGKQVDLSRHWPKPVVLLISAGLVLIFIITTLAAFFFKVFS